MTVTEGYYGMKAMPTSKAVVDTVQGEVRILTITLFLFLRQIFF